MSITADVSKLYDEYGARLVSYPLHGYQAPSSIQPVAWRKHAEEMLRLGRADTHGLLGAMAFLFLNDIVRDFPEPQVGNAKGAFCIEWAAMAIMMHDMQKVYAGADGKPTPAHPCLRVSFESDPLSFVVALVDQIQDFCRPNAKFSKGTSDSVKLMYPDSCTGVKVVVSKDGPMRLTYIFERLSDVLKNKAVFKREAERDYFDPSIGFLDWTGLPITGIHLDAELSAPSLS